MPWQPILSGELKDQALKAVEDVAEEISGPKCVLEQQQPLCETALLFAYLSKAKPHGPWRDLAINELNRQIEQVSLSPPTVPLLYGGLSGIGWSVEHLSKLLFVNDDGSDKDDEVEAIDGALLTFLTKQTAQVGVYDLVGGLVGIGIYFLERLPRQTAVKALTIIVGLLELWAETAANGGVTWYTPHHCLPDIQRQQFPGGFYNLGLAHGVPGIQLFLGELIGAGICKKKATFLLEHSTQWLLARQLRPNMTSRFGWIYLPGVPDSSSRLAWCYGDLGIAAVLQQTAMRAEKALWRTTANDVLLRCTLWPVETSGVRDTGLCHGALGVAHIFNRVYQRDPYGNEHYKEAAKKWIKQGLDMRQPELGIGGFFSWKANHTLRIQPDSSFLTGAIGAALALLSASTATEAGWDRVLGLSGSYQSVTQREDT